MITEESKFAVKGENKELLKQAGAELRPNSAWLGLWLVFNSNFQFRHSLVKSFYYVWLVVKIMLGPIGTA